MQEFLPVLAMKVLTLGFPSRFSSISTVVIEAVSVENCDYILYQMAACWKLSYSNAVQPELSAFIFLVKGIINQPLVEILFFLLNYMIFTLFH